MSIILIVLKLIMFAIIVVGPVMIGRHIVQAAKGNQLQPASVPAAAAETEDAA